RRRDWLAGGGMKGRRQRRLEIGLDVVPPRRKFSLGEDVLGRHVNGLASHRGPPCRELLPRNRLRGQRQRSERNRTIGDWSARPTSGSRLAPTVVEEPCPVKRSYTGLVTTFARFVRLCRDLETSPRRLDKLRLVAEFLRALDASEVAAAVAYLTGRPFPSTDTRVLGVRGLTIEGLPATEPSLTLGDVGDAFAR